MTMEADTSGLTPRQIGYLIEDLREELEETRMEINLLDARLKHGDLSPGEYTDEKRRLSTYMKRLIARVTDLQKMISKKDRDLAREVRQLQRFFQVDELGNDSYLIYLAPSPANLYAVQFSLASYPEKPEIQWPQEVYEQIGDPDHFVKALKSWDPGYPSPVYEIFQAFESYGWKYFNAVQALKDELREVEGEFVYQLLRDNYLRITLYSFDKKEYGIEVDVERYPRVEWKFPPELEKLIGSTVDEFMDRYKGASAFPKMVDILHDVSWEIDKQNRLAFDYKLLANNVSEAINGLTLDPVAKTISGFIDGELKTETTRFEFTADFSKGYPEQPPEISLRPVGSVEDEVLGKLQHYIAESGATWDLNSFFVDLLNKIHMAIFKSSIVTCVICHKLFCPTCDNPLYLPKGMDAKTCHVVCSNCKRPYHKHCHEKTISAMGKCAVCMQSFVAENTTGGKQNLELDF